MLAQAYLVRRHASCSWYSWRTRHSPVGSVPACHGNGKKTWPKYEIGSAIMATARPAISFALFRDRLSTRGTAQNAVKGKNKHHCAHLPSGAATVADPLANSRRFVTSPSKGATELALICPLLIGTGSGGGDKSKAVWVARVKGKRYFFMKTKNTGVLQNFACKG